MLRRTLQRKRRNQTKRRRAGPAFKSEPHQHAAALSLPLPSSPPLPVRHPILRTHSLTHLPFFFICFSFWVLFVPFLVTFFPPSPPPACPFLPLLVFRPLCTALLFLVFFNLPLSILCSFAYLFAFSLLLRSLERHH